MNQKKKINSLTKEQEETLMKAVEKNRKTTKYVCKECSANLVGLDEVDKHVEENQHYSYKCPGVPGFEIGVL